MKGKVSDSDKSTYRTEVGALNMVTGHVGEGDHFR